ncbi:conjugative transposon protein TraM [Ilyomonas limi]|uniref:Conjugative transposon protein TraM n=1 Tax=Ilyomonas limi TaxID=2575867 RepID=A0A4V5UTT2_9BACT|nr:conjugative transposon protein TraM [Ilyomonas limi]TKK66333.1 conjugative transposon protein TraM [Ilyomonas limi]
MKQLSTIGTDKQKKKRQFLLIMPLIVLPFLTFLFWSLGVIGADEAKASATTSGLNMHLPDAKLKENKSWNKLSFYEQAEKDSAKYREAIKNDPFFHMGKDSVNTPPAYEYNSSSTYNPMPQSFEDPNEYKVNQKLAQLNAVLNNSNKEEKVDVHQGAVEQRVPGISSNDVKRLEQMLQVINQPDSEADPETQQLNGIMDKILAIQHPERITETAQQTSEKNKKSVFRVVSRDADNYLSLLQAPKRIKKISSNKENKDVKQNAFHSLENDTVTEEKQNIIEAKIQETQTIINGSTVKLCLANDIYVNGMLVPQSTFIYGTASLNAERLRIAINSIHYQNNLLPVALSVYDLDGIAGIYIPGSVSRDVAKQTGSEAVNNFGIASLDPSIGVQAANAGITAAKTLIDKKVKQIKVTIRAGYKVLLKDDNQQQ